MSIGVKKQLQIVSLESMRLGRVTLLAVQPALAMRVFKKIIQYLYE